MAEYNVPALAQLTEQFERLPGIGHKTAARLAYYVISMNDRDAKLFSDAIINAHEKIRFCKVCGNITDSEVCSICSDARRNRDIICVVEDPRDVMAFEKTNEYRALYHVLHGVISPIKGVFPDQLWIKELLARLHGEEVKEVILATNATVEGEATAMYISKLIRPFGIKTSRLAFGLPIGSSLEYADEVTLSQSIENRKELS